MKRKRKKVKYKSFGILFIVIIGIVLLVKSLPKEKQMEEEIDYQNYIGKTITSLDNVVKDKKIIKDYQYNKDYLKDEIVDIKALGDTVSVVVSKGMIDDSVYRDKKVNELGNVPIMMYHGIVDTKDNKYTGGNVDKDGYNRTADAFRNDLEFFYESGYRMIRLSDYAKGIIDVEIGYSPIIITFDDGNKNNFNVLGKNGDGSLEIDPNCAVGILEEFKKKHPDAPVTAIFFLMEDLFNQKEYNEEIMHWLILHGYDIGNHTTTHPDFTKITVSKTQEVVGKMYQKLDSIIKGQYQKIVALPFGSPYKKTHANYPYILKGTYNDTSYETEVILRVGWEPELSPFNKDFDKTFLKRCRAYDNNGKEFDIESVFKNLEKKRFVSDGDKDLIVIRKSDEKKINSTLSNVHIYKED